MTRTTRVAIALLEFVSLVTSSSRWTGSAVIALIVAVAGAMLGLECYELVTGTVDLSRHIPLLIPAVLIAFVYVVWWMDHRPAPSRTRDQ